MYIENNPSNEAIRWLMNNYTGFEKESEVSECASKFLHSDYALAVLNFAARGPGDMWISEESWCKWEAITCLIDSITNTKTISLNLNLLKHKIYMKQYEYQVLGLSVGFPQIHYITRLSVHYVHYKIKQFLKHLHLQWHPDL